MSKMSKAKVPYHRLVKAGFPAKINNSAQGSSAPMQPHPAPGRAAGTIKAVKETTPESLFPTCQAGFRSWEGGGEGMTLQPWSSMFSAQVIQHFKSCFIMLCLNLWHIFVSSLFGHSYKKLECFVCYKHNQRKEAAKASYTEFENQA